MKEIKYINILKKNEENNIWLQDTIRISSFLDLINNKINDSYIKEYSENLLFIIKKIREIIYENKMTIKDFFINEEKIIDLFNWIKENKYDTGIEHIYLDIYENSNYSLRESIYFIEKIMSYNTDLFWHIGDKNNNEIVLTSYIRQTKSYMEGDFKDIISKICLDKDNAFELIKNNEQYITYILKIHDDDFLKKVIKEFPYALIYLDSHFQNELTWLDLVLLKDHPMDLQYIDDEHKYRRYVILRLVEINSSQNLYRNLRTLNIMENEITEYGIDKILSTEQLYLLKRNRQEFNKYYLSIKYRNDISYPFFNVNFNSNYRVAKQYILINGFYQTYNLLGNNLKNVNFIKECLKDMEGEKLVDAFYEVQNYFNISNILDDFDIMKIFLEENISMEDIMQAIKNENEVTSILNNKKNMIEILEIIKNKKDSYDLLNLFNYLNSIYNKDIHIFKLYFDILYEIKEGNESLVEFINKMHYDTRNNIDIAYRIVLIDSNCFSLLGFKVRNNTKIVKKIKEINPYMLRYASLKQQLYNIFI